MFRCAPRYHARRRVHRSSQPLQGHRTTAAQAARCRLDQSTQKGQPSTHHHHRLLSKLMNPVVPKSLTRSVLADGADGLKNLVDSATQNPALSILNWFHISMRFRPIEQMAPKIASLLDKTDPVMAAMIRIKLPRVRHHVSTR